MATLQYDNVSKQEKTYDIDDTDSVRTKR